MLTKSREKHSLMSLTPEVMVKHRDKRLQDGKSARALGHELALLFNLYNIAFRECRIGLSSNPISIVRNQIRRQVKIEGFAVTNSRFSWRLLTHVEPYAWLVVRLTIYMGMRLGELLGIRCDQLNLNRRTNTLTETKNDSHERSH